MNEAGDYCALYINVEAGQSKRDNEIEVVKGVLSAIQREAKHIFKNLKIEELYLKHLKTENFSEAITLMLSDLCNLLPRPLVLFIDEIDALVGDSLVSVLRQIRAGYAGRPENFPQTIILCGVRDVRDYRIVLSNKEVIPGGSAFNIKAKSLRLGNFSREEVRTLYELHTTETGQKFEEECFPLIWDYTEGQPWLVNVLANEVTSEIRENRDRSITITPAMIRQAKENIVLRRETHIDILIDKLQEERVKRVITPILSTEETIDEAIIPSDDVQYVIDLGLIVRGKPLRIANSIYKEVIPRELTWTTQEMMVMEEPA